MKRFSMLILAIVAIAATGLMTPEQVQARPNYFAAFKKKYDKVEKVDDTKCGICHGDKDGMVGGDKKKLSKYAKEFGTALGGKNVKDDSKIEEAFKTAETKDAGDKKTYGDILKSGKLPAKAE